MKTVKTTLRRIFKSPQKQSTSLVHLNKELCDQVNELKAELEIVKEDFALAQREISRQSELRQQAEARTDRFESQKMRETKINSDAIDSKLVMQGVLFRAREVAGAMEPLLIDARDALLELPPPQTEDQESAISTITYSLGRACKYVNMIGNDGKGTENLLITSGVAEEKAKKTGEAIMFSAEAKALKRLLEKRYKRVAVWEMPQDGRLNVQIFDGSIPYHGVFPANMAPDSILDTIEKNLNSARVEHRKDCVPEGDGLEYGSRVTFHTP